MLPWAWNLLHFWSGKTAFKTQWSALLFTSYRFPQFKKTIYRLIYIFSGLKWINCHLLAKASKSYNFNKTYFAGHLGGYFVWVLNNTLDFFKLMEAEKHPQHRLNNFKNTYAADLLTISHQLWELRLYKIPLRNLYWFPIILLFKIPSP